MLEMDHLASASDLNIKFDKVVVWENGGRNGDGTEHTELAKPGQVDARCKYSDAGGWNASSWRNAGCRQLSTVMEGETRGDDLARRSVSVHLTLYSAASNQFFA